MAESPLQPVVIEVYGVACADCNKPVMTSVGGAMSYVTFQDKGEAEKVATRTGTFIIPMKLSFINLEPKAP